MLTDELIENVSTNATLATSLCGYAVTGLDSARVSQLAFPSDERGVGTAVLTGAPIGVVAAPGAVCSGGVVFTYFRASRTVNGQNRHTVMAVISIRATTPAQRHW